VSEDTPPPRRPPGRFLAPKARGDEHGYVADSRLGMRDEPEAIGPAILDGYAEGNAFRFAQQHAADVLAAQTLRPLLRAEDRLRDAERRAKQSKRRDLKGEFAALRGMLDREQRRGVEPRPQSALLVRLERVEATLDGIDEAA
jgi:hypothetical protein